MPGTKKLFNSVHNPWNVEYLKAYIFETLSRVYLFKAVVS